MNILAIDTSSDVCSVAVLKDIHIEQKYELAPQRHGQLILPSIEYLLTKQHLQLRDLDVIAFGSGPGSYTGLRIGISVVQALAFASDLLVLPISSMRALAQQVWENSGEKAVLICQDARMQEIYWSGYSLNPITNLMEVVIPDQLTRAPSITVPQDSKWCGIGDGWQQYPELALISSAHNITIRTTSIRPEARFIAKIAAAIYSEDLLLPPEEALPTYLRQATAWKKIEEQH